MISEQAVRDLLIEAGDKKATPVAPVDGLIAAGRRARVRRHQQIFATAAAVVTVAVGCGLGVRAWTSRDTTGPSQQQTVGITPLGPGHAPLPRELIGGWRPTGVINVDPRTGGPAHRDMWLFFGWMGHRFRWSAGDGCNPTAGLFRMHSAAAYTTHSDFSTSVGCLGSGFNTDRPSPTDVVVESDHVLLNGNRLTFYADGTRTGTFIRATSFQ